MHAIRFFLHVGFIYLQQKRWEEALRYYERTLSILEQKDDVAGRAVTFNNIGFIYLQQEKWEEAIVELLKSLGLYEQLGKCFEERVVTLMERLALCYTQLGETEKCSSCQARAGQIRAENQEKS
jgi:tetratricopeptide (TPR) repeat protein